VHGKSVVYAKKVLILALSGHTLKSVRSSGKTFSVPNTPMGFFPRSFRPSRIFLGLMQVLSILLRCQEALAFEPLVKESRPSLFFGNISG